MLSEFKCVEILKSPSCIGIGAYGKVCKAKCGDLICAAKLIHETMFDPAAQHQLDKAAVKPVRRFEQECEFMKNLRHPNVVQYLGLHEDPSSGLPVLLMELMDQNLTSFLKNSSGPLPYHLHVNFCHDIALALSYLHSNEVIHRDLSSNNVLLIGNVRAKVSDFGMARLGDLHPSASRTALTKHLGTEAYMPPECHLAEPDYTEKVDCFSLGVIIVQILTRRLPHPGEKYMKVKTDDPKFPGGFAFLPATEVDRRRNHIDDIDAKHPLRNLALNCLKDRDVDRPSAQEICEHLCDLKDLQEYTESKESIKASDSLTHKKSTPRNHSVHTCDVGINTEKGEEIVELEKQLEYQKQQLAERNEELKKSKELIEEQRESVKEKDELVEMKDATIEELKQTVDSRQEAIEELRRQLEQMRGNYGKEKQVVVETEQRLAGVEQQLNTCTREKDALQKQVCELQQLLSLRLMSMKESKKAPYALYRSSDATVSGSTVYLRPACTRDIFRYHQASGWSKLPEYPFESSSLVIVNGSLTVVGGCLNNTCVNQLLSLAAASATTSRKKWKEEFPRMPTKRSHTSTLCTGKNLIIAGGKGDRGVVLRTVEVLSIESGQWSIAAELPEPCWCSSMMILDRHLCLVGGVNVSGNQSNLFYTCSVDSLLQSRRPVPSQAHNNHEIASPERHNSSPAKQNGVSPTGQNGVSPTRTQSGGTNAAALVAVDWKRMCDLPVTQSTSLIFQGRLLTISGKNASAGVPTPDIFVYSPIMDSWEVVGHLLTGRFACFAAVLPDNLLMIVGGYTDSKTAHDSIEFVSNV